jgi:MoxR-like ATPase
LGEDETGQRKPIPIEWARTCAWKLRNLRDELRSSYVGLNDVIDWLLATLVARENALLLGPPGVAKSELAIRVYRLLGLDVAREPEKADITLSTRTPASELRRWWVSREEHERESQKYFHYLLSRFTQPEELFGPVEISLLRRGFLVRVNFGLLTGPGVRAAFLDEIFKASSAILNTLLTLAQERQYFNWGGMVPSDLHMLIGASNELPGGFGTGAYGVGTGVDDFQSLYAFLDRFPMRLLVPAMSGTSQPEPENSDLAKAFDKAIRREAQRFVDGAGFQSRVILGRSGHDMPGINDLLLLGRCVLESQAGAGLGLFDTNGLARFRQAFLSTATDLQQRGTAQRSTGAHLSDITWTISPRKLKALWKIALAHAVVADSGFAGLQKSVKSPHAEELRVFEFIWDSPVRRLDLTSQVRTAIGRYLG